jgi:hypothetical protein
MTAVDRIFVIVGAVSGSPGQSRKVRGFPYDLGSALNCVMLGNSLALARLTFAAAKTHQHQFVSGPQPSADPITAEPVEPHRAFAA